MTQVSPAVISSDAARRAARNAAALTLSSILAKGAQFLWQLALARLLMQEEYGIYGTILGMVTIAATLVDFGIGTIVLRDVSRQRELAGRVLAATLVIQSLLGVLVYIALLLVGRLAGYEADILVLLPLAGLSLVLDVLGTMARSILLAREQMVIAAVVDVIHIALQIALAGLALLGGGGLPGLYGAMVTASALRALLFWIILRWNGVITQWPLDRALAWRLVTQGAPLAVNAFLLWTYQSIDKPLVTATLGQMNTALLMPAAVLVVGVVELLNITAITALFPLLSRQYGEGQVATFRFLVQKLALFTLIVVLPIAVWVTVLAPFIIGLLFPAAYEQSVQILQGLIWYGVATMVANAFAISMIIQGDQVWLMKARGAGLLIYILLMLLLLSRVGVVGAPVSSLTAECLVLALLLWKWEPDGAWLRSLLPRLARLAGIAGVMLLVAAGLYAFGMAALWPPILAAIVAVLASGAIYGAAVWLGGVIAPDDRAFLQQFLAAVPGGRALTRMLRLS